MSDLSNTTVITAALTGPIASKRDNPALPTTPEEIAADAHASWRAGAAVAHVHLRDASGEPTADVGIARQTIELIEERCPVIVQLSTGVGLDVAFEEREALVEARPAMATLNVCSMSFAGGEFRNPPNGVRRLAYRMRELGVRPELEIYDTGHLEVALSLREEGLLADPLQLSIVLGVRGGAAATPANLIEFVRRLPADAIWQVVAIGRDNLAMTTMGIVMGGNARTGLEDTLMLRRRVPASSNAVLVERLARIAQAVERGPAAIDDVYDLFSLDRRHGPSGIAGDPRHQPPGT